MNRARWSALVWLAIAGAGIGTAAGCGRAGQHPSTEAPASAFAYSDARKDEIKDLWMQIRGWRVEMGLVGAEPNRALKTRMTRTTPVAALRRVCEPPPEPSESCTDVCNLAEAICDNASDICRIAGDLGDDYWAKEKCRSAKASCQEAKEHCCGCEGENGHTDAP